MCMYCRTLDDYEARHGHKCDDECLRTCDACSVVMCSYEDAEEDKPYYFEGEVLCRKHFELNRALLDLNKVQNLALDLPKDK